MKKKTREKMMIVLVAFMIVMLVIGLLPSIFLF